MGHYLLTAIVNPSNQQVRIISIKELCANQSLLLGSLMLCLKLDAFLSSKFCVSSKLVVCTLLCYAQNMHMRLYF